MSHNHDPFSPKAAVKAVRGKKAAVTKDAPQPEPDLSVQTGEQAPAPQVNENGVPQGTATEVLDWVGEDKDKAQLALDAEDASGEPRKTVVAKLQGILE